MANPQNDPLGILGDQPKEIKVQADPLGILKKKELSKGGYLQFLNPSNFSRSGAQAGESKSTEKNLQIDPSKAIPIESDDILGDAHKLASEKLFSTQSQSTINQGNAFQKFQENLAAKKELKDIDTAFGNNDQLAGEVLSDKLAKRNPSMKPMKKNVGALDFEEPKEQPFNHGDISDYSLEEIKKHINPKNRTEQLAFNTIKKSRDIEHALGSSADVEEAALKYAAATNPQLGKQYSFLKSKGLDLPEAQKGQYVAEFISDPAVQKKAENDNDLKLQLFAASNYLYDKYPQYGKKVVAQKISQYRENAGANNPIVNIPRKAETDDMVNQMVKDGILSEKEKNIYQEQIRPDIGLFQSLKRGVGRLIPGVQANMDESPIATPGFLESAENSYNRTLGNMAHTVEDAINTVTSGGGTVENGKLFTPQQRLYDMLAKDYSQVSVNPKGFANEFGQAGGDIVGFVAPMILGGQATKALGMNPLAGELLTNTLMFEGQNKDYAIKTFPGNNKKQLMYTTIATPIDVLLLNAIPNKGLSNEVKKDLQGEIKKTIQDFTDDKITAAVAKENLFNTIAAKIPRIAKDNAKMGAIMSGFDIIHNGLDAAFGGRDVGLDESLNSAVQSFKHGFLGNTFLSAIHHAGGEPKLGGKVLRELAENPETIREMIENDAKINPESSATKDERLKNLETITKTWREIKEFDASEPIKEQFLLKDLQQKILEERAKNATVDVVKDKNEKKVAELKIEKQRLIDPEMGNKKFIEELYDEDLLPKGSKLLLEDEKGKFAEHKVGSYLKFIAQQANGLDENWKPTGEKGDMTSIPESVVEAANERWKKELAEADKIKLIGEDEISPTVELNPEVPADFKLPETEKIESEANIQPINTNANKTNVEPKAQNQPTVQQELQEENDQRSTSETSEATTGEKEVPAGEKPKGRLTAEKFDQMLRNDGDRPSGITHAKTADTRTEFGLPKYEKTTKKDADLEIEADELVKKGFNVNNILDKIEGEAYTPTDVENTVLKRYIPILENEVRNNPSNENLAFLKRFVDATDIAGTIEGRGLRSRKGMEFADDSLAGFFTREISANKDAPLTEKQKETVIKEHTEIEKAQNDYNEKIEELTEKDTAGKAQEEINKIKKTAKDKKKDYAAERKAIIDNILFKVSKAGSGEGASFLGVKEIASIAPDVAKLVRNVVEQGVTKLGEVIDAVHDLLKDQIPDLEKKHIHDIIAGVYSEKKTRNELAATLYDLRTQAKLVNRLEDLENGIEPKSEREKIKRNQEIEELKKKVKEHDLTKLSNYKSRVTKQIQELENDLKTGNFTKEEKKPLKMDKEALELRNKLIDLKHKREIRLINQEYGNKSFLGKASMVGQKILGIPRVLKSSFDVSMPFRQGLWGVTKQALTLPIGDNANFKTQKLLSREFAEMYKSFGSEKVFKRVMTDIKENPRYEVAEKSGLMIADPYSLKSKEREESFGPNYVEKVPVIGQAVKGSERAATSFVNTMKWNIYNGFVDIFERNGKTYENSPKDYEAAATYANQAVGRGKLGKNLENANAITSRIFFSLRLQASRLQLLTNFANPAFYVKVPKEVRNAYLKDAVKFVGTWMAAMTAAYNLGYGVNLNPASSSFGKVKVGDTEYDTLGGFSQWFVFLTRMISGKTVNNKGETVSLADAKSNRLKLATRFGRSKLSPEAGFVTNSLEGKDYLGQETSVGKEAEGLITPLIYSDIKDVSKDASIQQVLITAILAAHGIGVQTRSSDNDKKSSNHERPKH